MWGTCALSTLLRITQILQIIQITSCDLGYHSLLYGSIGSILDRAWINQLASSDSSLSSRNIVFKASVITLESFNISLSSLLAKAAACHNSPLNAVSREKLSYVLIWLLNIGGRVTTVLILKLYVKVGGDS